jgi:hypothetical protein
VTNSDAYPMQLRFPLGRAVLVRNHKTIRRTSTNLIPFEMAKRYFVDSTWLTRLAFRRSLSFSQVGTQHVRGRHSPRDADDSSLNMAIVQLILGRANANVAHQLEGFTNAAKPQYRSKLCLQAICEPTPKCSK